MELGSEALGLEGEAVILDFEVVIVLVGFADFFEGVDDVDGGLNEGFEFSGVGFAEVRGLVVDVGLGFLEELHDAGDFLGFFGFLGFGGDVKTLCSSGKDAIVFNSLGWERKALVELPGSGKIPGTQSTGGKSYAEVKVPPCGFARIDKNIIAAKDDKTCAAMKNPLRTTSCASISTTAAKYRHP